MERQAVQTILANLRADVGEGGPRHRIEIAAGARYADPARLLRDEQPSVGRELQTPHDIEIRK